MNNPKNNTKINNQAIKLFIDRILNDPAWPELLMALSGYDVTDVAERDPVHVSTNNEKASVKIELVTNHTPLRVKIKTFKSSYADNHLERRKHRDFCDQNGLQHGRDLLEDLWLRKAADTDRHLVDKKHELSRIARMFAPIDFGKTLCGKDKPQVLALYNGTEKHWHLYDMKKDVLPLVQKQSIGTTPRGNIQIGKYIVVQRRGSEGVKGTSHTDIDHCSNGFAVKLKVKKFYNEVEPLVKTALAKRR